MGNLQSMNINLTELYSSIYDSEDKEYSNLINKTIQKYNKINEEQIKINSLNQELYQKYIEMEKKNFDNVNKLKKLKTIYHELLKKYDSLKQLHFELQAENEILNDTCNKLMDN